MNAKRELEMLEIKSEEIDSLYQELERVRAIAEGMGGMSDSEHIQTSATADKLEKSVIQILETEEKLNDTIEQYLTDRATIMDAIMHIEGPAIRRQAVYQKYVKHSKSKILYDSDYVSHQRSLGIRDIQIYLDNLK